MIRSVLITSTAIASGRTPSNLTIAIDAQTCGGDHEFDPYDYLKDVLTRLPTQRASEITELLSHKWATLNQARCVGRTLIPTQRPPGDGQYSQRRPRNTPMVGKLRQFLPFTVQAVEMQEPHRAMGTCRSGLWADQHLRPRRGAFPSNSR